MMSFYLSGGVEVLGFISPTEPTDEYPVIDPLYGIDGFRNVDTLSELNSIPNLRRRAGMVVGVSGGTQYYKLNPQPWNGTITDWDTFSLGGGTFTGGTVTGDTIFTQGVTATTFSASTYLGLPLDVFVTGGTYSNGTLTFTNNSGGTFNVTGLSTGTTINLSGGTGISISGTSPDFIIDNTLPDQIVNLSGGTNINITGTYPNFGVEFTGVTSSPFTGGTVTGDTIFTQGLTATTFSASTYLGLPLDVYTTGFTFNPSTYDISIERNDGVTLTQNLGILATDVTITGGTYDPLNGSITFVNNTGGTFTVTGFLTGFTDIQVTGYTYQDNTFTISDSSGNTFPATIDVMTGLTINGDLTVTGTTSLQGFSATTISATTIGTSGDCVDDIYVSNIHSCSPLNINPLNEGNVYFGSTSGVTIDLTNNKVGIGTSLPQETLHISGTSRFDNDVTIWDDGVFNGNSRKLYFRGLGQTGNTQTGQIFLDAYGNTNGEILELRSGGGVRLGATGIDGTIQVYNFASNYPIIQSVQTGGLGFNVNSTTNGFTFTQGYVQTTGDLFSIYNSGPTKAFSILASNGNVGIGNITPQYKLDVSGETRSRDRIYAGVFTPGTMLQPTDYFATTGRIVAGGGINFRSPINNDNTWTGFGYGGFDTAGIAIKIRNGEIGSFGGYGGDVNPYLYFSGFFNPISGNTSKNFIQLNPTYSTPNDLSYTGGIRGFLYNPILTSISGVSFHRAIETTTGDVIFGSTSGNVGIGTTSPSAKLQVSGTTLLQTFTGTTGLISAATQNVLTVIGSGNTTSSPIFTVQGSSGELFSVSDSLVGSLFSVNDISGLPILEVFSDNTTLMGSYLAPSLNTTAKVTATTGTTNVYSIPTSAYTGAFFDYTVSDGTNLRAGNIMSIWSGTSVNYSETSTTKAFPDPVCVIVTKFDELLPLMSKLVPDIDCNNVFSVTVKFPFIV